MSLRVATEGDLDALVELSSQFRDRLQTYEPTFWRRHPDADSRQRGWFELLLRDESHHIIVSESSERLIDGFLVARSMDAPPVYDPGGRTCLIDDFVWTAPDVADALLAGARSWAGERGCSQLVVISPAADGDRRALLDRHGLHPVSEWWSGSVAGPPGPDQR